MRKRNRLINQIMVLGLVAVSGALWGGNRWFRGPLTKAGDAALTPGGEIGSNVPKGILTTLTTAADSFWDEGEIATLRRQVMEHEARIAALQTQLDEKGDVEENLRALLTHRQQHDEAVEFAADSRIVETKGISAWSVATDSSSYRYSALINRGSEHRVRNKAPVTSGGVLVGQVRSVTPKSSRVLFICDPGMSVAVRFLESKASERAETRIQRIKPRRGLLRGLKPGLCRVDYVERDVDVRVGDPVVTSGEDGQFPSGLLVGKVSSLKRRELFLDVEVETAATFNALQTLLVLQPVKGDSSRDGQLATSE